MERQQRRAIGYVALLLGVVALYTVAYDYGMGAFEGEPVSLLHAFHIVIETFTTTGYGEDAPWSSPYMLLLVDGMQLTGIFLIFLTLPLFAVPWVERRLEVEPPTDVDLTDHVVICGYGPRGETLVDELDVQDVPYVFLEADRDVARSLHTDGTTVVYGDPGTTDALSRVNVESARAVVIDEDDERNATIALSVRELDADVQVIGFVEDPDLATYIDYAGADRVLSPTDILGRSLADKVTSAVTTDLGDTVEIGEDFEIVEMPIQRGSKLDGVTLAASGIREQTGVNVIGAWIGGGFQGAPDPGRTIDRHTVLLVAGTQAQLSTLKELTLSAARKQRTDRVVIGGGGEVGTTVRDILAAEGIETVVVDRQETDSVDVLGDATDESTLMEAGLGEASALILALGDDTRTVFATLVARKANDEVEIICRANEAENVPKLYAAGADYVLALSTVSGRMLAQTILGEDVMALGKQIDVVRTEAPALEGMTLAGANVRSRTGATVIAVEREADVLTDLGPDFEIRADDSLIVAGTDENVSQFIQIAGVRADRS